MHQEEETPLMTRCIQAEVSLRKETELNERNRVEIQMLKDGI